jgi:iron uptake system component EfeO
MRNTRLLGVASAAAVLVAGLAACTKDEAPGAATTNDVAVTATDTACTLASTNLAAGVSRFTITNTGSKITEFYVFKGDKALGEVENISPGTSRKVSIELSAGTYDGVCKPGMVGDGIKQAFTVTGTATALSEDQKLANAVTNYKAYVQSQVDLLVPKTKEFTDAIRANNVAKAKELFPLARAPYEAIEPVAESFGDLDPSIDARDGDLDPGVEWTGFHVLEQHLWVAGDISKDAALADRLDADVKKLSDLVKTVELKPLEIANGAKELLDEVATSKITGEEDRYSHTDLWDFAANLAGAKAAINALRSALAERDAPLLSDVDAKFVAVETLLNTYKVGEGYKLYSALTPADTKALADSISGLAEPISKVAAAITSEASPASGTPAPSTTA